MEKSGWKDYMVLWPVVQYLPTIHANFFQAVISPLSFRINSFWDRFFFCQENVDTGVARRMFRKNWEPMSTALLGQLRSAFKSGGLKSSDDSKFYADKLSSIKIPMLVLGGSVDKQSPAVAMEKIASLIEGSHYECLGKQNGQVHEYGESRILLPPRCEECQCTMVGLA